MQIVVHGKWDSSVVDFRLTISHRQEGTRIQIISANLLVRKCRLFNSRLCIDYIQKFYKKNYKSKYREYILENYSIILNKTMIC